MAWTSGSSVVAATVETRSRVPVRVAHSFLERRGDTGRAESTELVGYEIPMPVGDAATICVLESDPSVVFDIDWS